MPFRASRYVGIGYQFAWNQYRSTSASPPDESDWTGRLFEDLETSLTHRSDLHRSGEPHFAPVSRSWILAWRWCWVFLRLRIDPNERPGSYSEILKLPWIAQITQTASDSERAFVKRIIQQSRIGATWKKLLVYLLKFVQMLSWAIWHGSMALNTDYLFTQAEFCRLFSCSENDRCSHIDFFGLSTASGTTAVITFSYCPCPIYFSHLYYRVIEWTIYSGNFLQSFWERKGAQSSEMLLYILRVNIDRW